MQQLEFLQLDIWQLNLWLLAMIIMAILFFAISILANYMVYLQKKAYVKWWKIVLCMYDWTKIYVLTLWCDEQFLSLYKKIKIKICTWKFLTQTIVYKWLQNFTMWQVTRRGQKIFSKNFLISWMKIVWGRVVKNKIKFLENDLKLKIIRLIMGVKSQNLLSQEL